MNPLILFPLMILSVGFVPQKVISSSPAAMQAVTQKSAVPSEQAQKEILQKVQSIFSSEYSVRGRDGKLRLLDALIGLSEELSGVVDERYVVLCEARRVAIELRETLDAIELSRKLDVEYELSAGRDLIVSSYLATASKSAPEDRDSVITAGLSLLEECLQSAEIESAELVSSKVRILVKRASDESPLYAVWETQDRRIKSFSKVKVAVRDLQENPDDAKSCEIVGRFYVLDLGNFEAGLPLLARGENEDMKELAERELSGADEVSEQLGLGRLWLEVAGTLGEAQRLQALKRAQNWIQLSLGGLGTLERIGAQRELDAIATELSSLPETYIPSVSGEPVAARRVLERARGSAMSWLASHQDEDGKWDCDEFMGHDPLEDQCDGSGQAQWDTGVTGLSLLVFLQAGHSPQFGRYKDVVGRGLEWILTKQDPKTGLIHSGKGDHGEVYGHAIATIVLCESLRLSPDDDVRVAAQEALNFIEGARNAYAAWRYSYPGNGENDTSVTGWMLCALKAGESVGLNVDVDAYKGALAWIEEVTDKESGRVGYNFCGSYSSRMGGNGDFPAENSEALTSVGLLGRFMAGNVPSEDPMMERHASLIVQNMPTWSEDGHFADMYYWYFGTEALSRMGGDFWLRWSVAAMDELIGAQCSERTSAGSWDPIGPWGFAGGRVYSTAMAALTLGVIGGSTSSNTAKLKGLVDRDRNSASNDQSPLHWAEVLDRKPDSKLVTDRHIRKAIEDSGLPWRVRHDVSGVEFLLVPIDIEAGDFLYFGRYEVQESEWDHVLEGEALIKRLGVPKVAIRYSEVLDYIERVGDTDLRLPSESEWEVACRAGTKGLTYGELDEVAWNKRNSDGKLHVVGTRKANAFGLSDMLGNATEWCPNGILRGGSYRFGANKVTAEWRVKASNSIPAVGFRLVHEAR